MATLNCSTKSRVLVRVGDRIIGWLEGDTFIKPVYGSKHQLRTPAAWAIDATAFDEVVKERARNILVWEKESGTRYRASVEHFDKHKGVLDRGHGVQYYLVLSRWQIEPSRDAPRQLALALGNPP
ncbi:MAG: hypothetical protein HY669_00525 [Chloroflexi bacterium]|nr:hypothetical protein [Chloroflexota bacterium]